MKTGYDDFFKKAKQTSQPDLTRTPKPQLKKIQRSEKKRRPFPIKEITVFFTLFGICLFGYLHFEDIEKNFNKIDIGFSSAQAEEKAEAAESLKKSELDNETKKETVAQKPADEADYLFKLAERKKSLDEREESLNKLSQEIAKQKIEIEEKLKKLEETRQRISSVLEERIKTDDSRIETLVQMYSNMKPQQAAKVFETMDEDLVIEILGRMKKKNAADILNLVKPEKAQVLAERYVGYRAPASQQ